MRHIAALVILCLSWLHAVEAGPGTLTYYPETYAVTGTISATAAGSRGLVMAGSAISLLGQPAGSIALYNNGVASTLYTSGTCSAVDADKNGVIVALVAGSGGQQTLLRSTTAAPTFQEIPLPGFRTSPALNAKRIRITTEGGFLVVGSFQAQPGISRPSIVAQWSPTSGWTCLDGLTGTLSDLIYDGQGRILAAGNLSVAGTSLNLARFDTGTWTPVTLPTGWPTWYSYETFLDIRLAKTAIGDPVITTNQYGIGKVWLPSSGTWLPVAAPSDQYINALTLDGNDQPVAITGSTVMRWANGSWSKVGEISWFVTDSYPSISLVSTSGNGLTITGSWSNNRGNDVLMQWDGADWSNLGGHAVHPVNTRLGWVSDAGELVVTDGYRLMKHNGAAWTNLTDSSVMFLQDTITSTFKTTTGYGFIEKNDFSSNSVYLNMWDGTSWAKSTINGTIKSILSLPYGTVIVAGKFTLNTVEGTANNIARWDGSQWHRLSGGTGGEVNALLEQADGSILVGGAFTAVDGDLPMPGLARWNGTTWSRLNTADMPVGTVTALGHDVNGDVVIGLSRYAYTKFSERYPDYLSGVPLVYRWDNTAWSPLGVFSGSASVNTFVQDGRGGLIAQGLFNIADSIPVNGLARWDGNSWNSLGATVTSSNLLLESTQGLIGTSWGSIGRWTAPKIIMSSLHSNGALGRNFGTTSDRQPTVYGTGIPGEGYSLRQGSTTLLTGTVNANGRWSATVPGTWPDGVNSLTFVPADSSLPSQTAEFKIDSTPLKVERLDYLHYNTPTSYLEIILTLNKDSTSSPSFFLYDNAGTKYTVTKTSPRTFMFRVADGGYMIDGASYDFLNNLTDAAGNIVRPTVYISWFGQVSLSPISEDFIPLRLNKIWWGVDPGKHTSIIWYFSKSTTMARTFTIHDSHGNLLTVTRSSAIQFTITVPNSAYAESGDTLDFGTNFTDGAGNVINPKFFIAKDGTVTSPLLPPEGGSAGGGSATSDSSSGGGGCGSGAGVAVLLGAFLLTRRKRAA